MGEEFVTPKNQEANHPILSMMEDYAADLKQQNMLARFGQRRHLLQVEAPVKNVPGTPEYVGSDKCRSCHKTSVAKAAMGLEAST
jgi:hypothetical protein